jgi:hypothetical protein
MTPANDGELVVIQSALQHALDGIEAARKVIQGLRPSTDYAAALDALAEARQRLQRGGCAESAQ